MRRDVAGTQGAAARRAGILGGGAFPLFDLRDQIVERALDDLRITGKAVAHEGARVLQLLVHALLEGDHDARLGETRSRRARCRYGLNLHRRRSARSNMPHGMLRDHKSRLLRG